MRYLRQMLAGLALALGLGLGACTSAPDQPMPTKPATKPAADSSFKPFTGSWELACGDTVDELTVLPDGTGTLTREDLGPASGPAGATTTYKFHLVQSGARTTMVYDKITGDNSQKARPGDRQQVQMGLKQNALIIGAGSEALTLYRPGEGC